MKNSTDLDRQIKCVKKEIRRRKAIFPKLVAEGKLDEDRAKIEIVDMQDVMETLTQLKGILSR